MSPIIRVYPRMKKKGNIFLAISSREYLKTEKFTALFYNQTMLASTEKAMAPHSSAHAWKLPWAEEPGRLQSMGSLRVRHD